MSVNVTVAGVDRSAGVKGWVVHPRSLVMGHGTWKVVFENGGGVYNGVFAAQNIVSIGYDGKTYMQGYVDYPQHFAPFNRINRELHLFGRDYSQDLSNLLLMESYESAAKADDIIDDALNQKGSEITYTSLSTAPMIGGINPREQDLLSLFREICERANYDAYVDGSKALQFFPIGTVSSGIVIGDVDILEGWRNEGDAIDLRNTFRLRGERSLTLPSDMDEWTESATPLTQGYVTETGTTYVTKHQYSLSATALKYGQPFRVQFQYKCQDATMSYRIQYQIGGNTPVTVKTVTGIAPAAWANESYALLHEVTSNGNYAVNTVINVFIQIKVDYQPGTAELQNGVLYHQTTGSYWKDDALAQSLDIETAAYVKGSYSVKHYEAGVAGTEIWLQWDVLPIELRFSEYEYNKLKFVAYPIYSSGDFDKLEIRLVDGTGDYYVKEIYGLNLNKWNRVEEDLGVLASWAPTGTPDWNDIRSMKLTFYGSVSCNMTIYLDGFHFAGKRVSYSTQDNDSRKTYLPREYSEIIDDAPLADITARADSLKEKLKDPAGTVYIVVDGTKGIVGGVMKWLQGNTLKLDSTDLSVSSGGVDNYRMADIETQCWPKDTGFIQRWGRHIVTMLTLIPKTTPMLGERIRDIASPMGGGAR